MTAAPPRVTDPTGAAASAAPVELGWIDLGALGALGALGELGAAWAADAAIAAVRVSDDAPAASAGLVALDPGEVLARLHPDERSAGAALPIARRREWAAGRFALRAALERIAAAGAADVAGATGSLGLGSIDAPIGTDARGAPRLPDGWIGSISHKRGLALGLAARDAGDGWRLGLDVEHDAPSRAAIEGRVLTAAERDALPAADVAPDAPDAADAPDAPDAADARGRAVMLRFAVKEAVYKAVDPFVRRYVGFQEVELALAPAGGPLASMGGVARVTSALGLVIEAAWLRWHDCIVALARARA